MPRSETARIDSRHLGLEGVSPPFIRSLQVNLFLPLGADARELESRLSELRALAERSAAVLAEGRDACAAGRRLAGELAAAKAAVAQPMQQLLGTIADASARAGTLADLAARLDAGAGEARRLGHSATQASQTIRKLAARVCEETQKLRNTAGREEREALFENLQGLVTSVHADKDALDADALAAASLADGAQADLDGALAALDALAGAEAHLAVLEAQGGNIETAISGMRETRSRLEASVRDLARISDRAQEMSGSIAGLLDAMPQEAAARFAEEVETMQVLVSARLSELAACAGELERAQEDGDTLQSDVADVLRRYRELAGRVDAGGPIAGQGDALRERARRYPRLRRRRRNHGRCGSLRDGRGRPVFPGGQGRHDRAPGR